MILGFLPVLRAFGFWLFEGTKRHLLSARARTRELLETRDAFADLLAERFTHGLVHVGLSEVSVGSAPEAADAVFVELGRGLGFFCCPGFTPGFRRTRFYSPETSVPEVGSFSRLCMGRGALRTEDPIHSLFVFGTAGTGILDLPVRDTFAPEGVYRKFVEPGSCWINIGTSSIVSTAFHYIERFAGVPYLAREPIEGTLERSDGSREEVRQFSYRYRIKAAWNREKIERYLTGDGCLEKFYWKGALVRIIDGHLAAERLFEALRRDPYFLVT